MLHSNPVVAYLQRYGSAKSAPVPLTIEYHLTSDSNPSLYRAPSTNEPYSKISGDFNPIHMNPYFAAFATLPGTITHGMFTSAATRRYVETVVAKGVLDHIFKCVIFLIINPKLICIHSYDVNFVRIVLLGDELTVKIKHTAMHDGNFIVGVTTINQHGEKALEGTAEVAQPATVYTFTGQGSQEQEMGMDSYKSSPAARAVWDSADTHLISTYGFSIVEIVRENLKKKTIHFGSIKGQAIREHYMEMTCYTRTSRITLALMLVRSIRRSIPSWRGWLEVEAS